MSSPSLPSPSPNPWRNPHLPSFAIIGVAMIYMLHSGWERWNDPIVDFGRELYLPWQITKGRVLYRDLASFNGPLSPYLNALWFRCFGVSIHTLVYCNLAIVIAIVAMVYRLSLLISGRAAALAACLTFVFLSGFSRFAIRGNENYLAPYSHEGPHGVALSLAAILLLHRFITKPTSLWNLAAAGFVVGLSGLTKVEVFVAAAGAVGLGWIFHAWSRRASPRRFVTELAVLIGAALVPFVSAFLLLSLAMPAGDALIGTLGSIHHSIAGGVAKNQYFAWVSGFDKPRKNFDLALEQTGVVAAILAPAGLIAWGLRRAEKVRVAAGVVVLLATAAVLWFSTGLVSWPELCRSLTVFAVLCAGTWGVVCARRCAARGASGETILAATWTIFAVLLLLKIALNCRLNHYGFVLAMPALMVFAVMLVGWLPALVEKRGGAGAAVRGAGAALLLVLALFHVQRSVWNFAELTLPVSQGADRFYVHPQRDSNAAGLLAAMEERLGTPGGGGTLAVMPEGVMVNFLLRRDNPTAYTFFDPVDLKLFGESRVVAAYAANPPEEIVFVHADTTPYGARFFGQHYGLELYAWVTANYHEVGTVGPPPFRTSTGGMVVLKRN